jgi:hypothetical protein
MVIPWLGFELNRLLKDVEPTSHARFVAFTTLHDPARMPGQKSGVLDWPYVEGLRLDEALHPLTILATGLYGKRSQTERGAAALVVPWKYGFRASSRSSHPPPASNPDDGTCGAERVRFTQREPAWIPALESNASVASANCCGRPAVHRLGRRAAVRGNEPKSIY